VICDNNVRAFLSPVQGNLLQGADAAVHRHNKSVAFPPGPSKRLGVQTVSLIQAVGHIVSHLSPQSSEYLYQKGGGSGSVGVIISINKYSLSTAQGKAYSPDCLIHVRHGERIIKMVQTPLQKQPGLFNRGYPPVGKKPGQHRGYPQFMLKNIFENGIGLPNAPYLFIDHFSPETLTALIKIIYPVPFTCKPDT